MCEDTPESNHALLHRIDNRVEAIYTEVYGTGTTDGLVTKVDRLQYMKKDAGRLSLIVTAVTGAILIVIGKLVGLDFQGN